MKAKKLKKEVVTLKDGRYLVYYSWAKGKTEDRGRKTEDGRQKTVKLNRNN